jgi:hypothetical protein
MVRRRHNRETKQIATINNQKTQKAIHANKALMTLALVKKSFSSGFHQLAFNEWYISLQVGGRVIQTP